MYAITRLYLQPGESIDAAIERLAPQLIGGHPVAIWRADGLYCHVSYDPDCLMPGDVAELPGQGRLDLPL